MNAELAKRSGEMHSCPRHYPGFFLERLANNHEKLVHENRYIGPDTNRAHPERYR